MSRKILTSITSDINSFIQDPRGVLTSAENNAVAILINNEPVFYAITPSRLAFLLNIETHFVNSGKDSALLHKQLLKKTSTEPSMYTGKFTMHNGWRPDADFQRQAALWGIFLTKPVTTEELASFISWWQEEGKVFTHIQWQYKLARSIQYFRSDKNKQVDRNINYFSHPDRKIPYGFRGAKK